MKKLHFDETLFNDFFKSYKNSDIKPSKYWQDYTNTIQNEISKEGLEGFGSNYYLTKGFGDAKKIPARPKIRKTIKFKILYEILERFLAFYNHQRKQSLFKNFEKEKPLIDFIKFSSNELKQLSKDLGVNRTYKIYRKDIPWRYIQSYAYLKMFFHIIKESKAEKDLNDLFRGNVLDIGGGYGPMLDNISIYKKFNKIGERTTNYLLDQYPVSFIANQYLKFRHGENLLCPILKEKISSEEKRNEGQNFQVIQSNMANKINNLKIKFFFNSNSFQEMDIEQVQSYCSFIKKNKTEISYLGCFFYTTSITTTNNFLPSLTLLKEEFNLVGKIDSDNAGLIEGTMFLFKV